MSIVYKNTISVEDYNNLRTAAGWLPINNEQADAGLKGSTHIIVACHEEKVVGTARLIWDKGYGALIKDVLVLPEYQKMGIGKTMINKILDYLKENMKPGWTISVDLMAASGKEEFYKQLGFRSRPREGDGAGMDLKLVKDN